MNKKTFDEIVMDIFLFTGHSPEDIEKMTDSDLRKIIRVMYVFSQSPEFN